MQDRPVGKLPAMMTARSKFPGSGPICRLRPGDRSQKPECNSAPATPSEWFGTARRNSVRFRMPRREALGEIDRLGAMIQAPRGTALNLKTGIKAHASHRSREPRPYRQDLEFVQFSGGG